MNEAAGVGLTRDFKKMLALSFLFHVVLILPLFLASLKSRTMIIYSPVYTVDLVSPEKASRGRTSGRREKGTVAVETRKKATLSRKSVELLRKKKEESEKNAMALLSEKMALLREKRKLSEKIGELEKKRREKKEAEASLERIEKKLKELEEEMRRREREPAGETAVAAKERHPTGKAPGGSRGGITKETVSIGPEIKAYLNLLDERVRISWVVPRALVDNREDLMVQLRIVIETNGDVSSIVVERPSGNRLFDESVLRAIQKASPLPVPPESLREGRDYYEVGFRFHYFPGDER